jgi:hypothetical protein
MAPRTRKSADVAASANSPGTDPLDPSVPLTGNEPGDDWDTSLEEDAKGEISDELRHRMISEAAYHLYVERGYVDGLELDDWLQAEGEIDRMLAGRQATH